MAIKPIAMKRILFAACLLCCFLSDNLIVNAQPVLKKYVVYFTDKNNSPFTVSNPSMFLSQRAIDRHTKHGIAFSQEDLPVNQSYIDSIKTRGATVLNKSRWFNSVTISLTDTGMLQSVRTLPFVANLTPVALRTAEAGMPKISFAHESVIPLPKNLSKNSQTNYGVSLNQISMIAGNVLHDSGYKGQNMVIAVIDAGFWKVDSLPAFDSLRTHDRILGTWDFVTGDSNVYEDNAHGMEVLSVMGGNLPGQLVGTAPEASFWLLRSENTASEYLIEEYNWIAAAEFADSAGADIITSSLGYNTFDDASENHVWADMDGNTTPITIAADMAASKGILVVNSAGNEGATSWQRILAPADGDSVLTVGAVDAGGAYASFSSKGYSADGRVKPNVVCQGQNTIVAYASGGVGGASGTSFAGPVLAGMAACLWQASPSLSNIHLLKTIEESASQYNAPDPQMGYGIPNFQLAHLVLSGIGRNALTGNNLISLFPNPFTETIRLGFFSEKGTALALRIFDARGRLVFEKNKSLQAEEYLFLSLNEAAQLAPGMYILQVSSETNIFTHKLIRQ